MEGMVTHASFPKIVAKSLGSDFFTVLDIGCSGGLDSGWRNFEGALRAFGFDPSLAEVQRLNEKEENRNVKFVAGFVGVPSDCPGAELVESGNYWDRSPWNRLSVCKTLEIRSTAMKAATDKEKLRLNLWDQTQLADPKKPIIIPEFVETNAIDDIDFIKIDVDGADLLILRSMQPILESRKVIGVGIEVNFFGSDQPNVNTFHNVALCVKPVSNSLTCRSGVTPWRRFRVRTFTIFLPKVVAADPFREMLSTYEIWRHLSMQPQV
jgi:FkbM family methyltransferase